MLIVNYIISINNISNKYEFTEKTEDAMLNIFDCMNYFRTVPCESSVFCLTFKLLFTVTI